MVFLEHRPRVYYSLTTAVEATARFVQQHVKRRNYCTAIGKGRNYCRSIPRDQVPLELLASSVAVAHGPRLLRGRGIRRKERKHKTRPFIVMYGRVVFVLCQPAVTALHTAGWNSPIVEAKKKERKTRLMAKMAAIPDDCERTATVALPTAASPGLVPTTTAPLPH